MIKYRIREIEPESYDFRFYFDGDCFNKHSGDFNNTIFPLYYDHGTYCGLNEADYNDLKRDMDYCLTDVEDYINGYNGYKNVKEIMKDYNLPYSPKNAHALKEMAKQYWDKTEHFAEYMTIKTGKKWDIGCSHGYCQGDYVEIVYCIDNYKTEDIEIIGDIFLGCAKEFGVHELDEDGEEIDSCYGFFVADCQTRRDEDYKKIVCNDYGIPEEETELELIEGSHTYTKYTYKTI